MADPAHEQVMSPSALELQGAQERAGGQQDEGQQMPNGTTGATSSVTAKDVVTDGSQRIRSGIGDQGGDRVPGFLLQPERDPLPSLEATAAFAGVEARRLEPDDRQAALENPRAGAGLGAGVDVSAIAVDPTTADGGFGTPSAVRPQGSVEDGATEGVSVLPQGLRWMSRLGDLLRPSRVDRVQAQLWPSPFPSPERTRTAPGQTEVPSPWFSGDATRRLQAIQDRAPLLYGSPPQPQNPTPSSTSLSAEAIQAEVQRQLGPLVEHIQRLERLNEHLQQQASSAQHSQATAPELRQVPQHSQAAAPELRQVPQHSQAAAPELRQVPQHSPAATPELRQVPQQTAAPDLRPSCPVPRVSVETDRGGSGTSRIEGIQARSEGQY